MPEPTMITYAELRDDDILIDKSGGRWHVSGVEQPAADTYPVTFWLGDARTKVRAHHMTKPAGDLCTVDRVETLRDTVEKLEAQWPKPAEEVPALRARAAAVLFPNGDEHDAAVAAVEQGMPGAKVDADSTAAEVDAAAKATDDDPVMLPLFETMTDLEQRSHLFVLHGVFADDVDDRRMRADLHVAAHRDRAQLKLRSLYKPHEHSESVTA